MAQCAARRPSDSGRPRAPPPRARAKRPPRAPRVGTRPRLSAADHARLVHRPPRPRTTDASQLAAASHARRGVGAWSRARRPAAGRQRRAHVARGGERRPHHTLTLLPGSRAERATTTCHCHCQPSARTAQHSTQAGRSRRTRTPTDGAAKDPSAPAALPAAAAWLFKKLAFLF